MHELFLTAVISDADFDRATAVLQGLCGMTAWQSSHRVLFFSGPPGAPRGLSNSRSLQPSPYGNLWKELSQQLARQSFIIRLRYEVFKDKDFGTAGAVNGTANVGPRPVNFNANPGTLRWTDIPDPTGERPVTQRKKVEIPEQRNLVAVLEDNNYKIKSELIEQSYTYFRDGIEYSLVRYLNLPAPPPAGVAYSPQSLPAWEALTPVDLADKWILFVRSHVLEDNSPEKMAGAHEELVAVQKELLGVFEFKSFDRRAHDTRMAQQSLPQGGLRT